MTDTATKPKLDYYSYNRILSFNATYNFLCGARGLGKTYGAKVKAVRDAIRKGDQFIYLRRYKEELKAAKSTFFADIEKEFPGHVFRVQGMLAQMAVLEDGQGAPKKDGWRDIGFFVALSTAQSMKSMAFPKVKTIIFDEFIIEKNATHYLPEEATAFNNFYSTVDRWMDKTRVFFLANAVSIMNPYFLEYGITVDEETGEWVKLYDGFIVCHFADSKEFSTGVYKTRFGQFIKNTEYGDYAVKSKFSDNNDALLEVKGPRATYQYTLRLEAAELSVWYDPAGAFYIQETLPKRQIKYTFNPSRVNDDTMLMLKTDKLAQYLRSAFRKGNAYFDTPRSRNAFLEVFKR